MQLSSGWPLNVKMLGEPVKVWEWERDYRNISRFTKG